MKPTEEQIKRKKDKMKPERIDIIWQGEVVSCEEKRLGDGYYIEAPCLNTQVVEMNYEAY